MRSERTGFELLHSLSKLGTAKSRQNVVGDDEDCLVLRILRFLPNRTRQLDFPNRAALVKLAFHPHECRSLPFQNPNISIFGLLSYNGGNHSSNSAKFHFHGITCSFMLRASSRKRLLAFRLD